jgi:gamma-D-glutamyl-L-lysine dipeptidyl-peptidase
MKQTIVDSITVVPTKEIGELSWGIVTVSVANMRTEPRESAEMGSQALMGSVVRVWRKKGIWFYIQTTADKYLGWADDDQIYHCTKADADAWIAAEKVFVTVPFDFVKETATGSGPSVCDVVAGSVLKKLGTEGEWTRVGLADGRTGYIRSSSIVDQKQWGTSIVPTAEKLETTAKQFLGIPYLWGGTSAKAMDCSGFTRTVYLLNGVMLHRDANQQADDGVQIDPGTNWSNLRKGDLLFFGHKASPDRPERISHVAMYLQDRLFIHSSGKIRISSLDPQSPLYDEYHVKNFVRARRIMP